MDNQYNFPNHQVLTPKPYVFSQKILKDSQVHSSNYSNRPSLLKSIDNSQISTSQNGLYPPGINERLEEERRNLKIQQELKNQGSYFINHIKSTLPSIAQPQLKKIFPFSKTPQYRGPPKSVSKQLPSLTSQNDNSLPRYAGKKKSIVTSYEDDPYMDDDRTLKIQQKTIGLVYATRTKAGCQSNKQTKTNQDVAIINPKVIEQYGYNFFAVSDGHGHSGHLVSGYVKNNLPKNIAKYLKNTDLNSEGLTQALIKSFLFTNRQIFQSDIDSNLSGSTTTSILIKNNKLFSANVGDSRVVVCRYSNGQWAAVPLTIDHKPDDERERQRIIDRGGRVEAQKDPYGNPVGPERVWLSYIDAPGLAMTRSFGDKVGAQAGVIAEPEILEFTLTNEDKFIIVASDGVWDYMPTDSVMNLIIPFYNRNNLDQAVDRLIFEASNAWRRFSNVRDDITCIIIYLK